MAKHHYTGMSYHHKEMRRGKAGYEANTGMSYHNGRFFSDWLLRACVKRLRGSFSVWNYTGDHRDNEVKTQ